MSECPCCHRMYVVQDQGHWMCFFCDISNKTSWKCRQCHNKSNQTYLLTKSNKFLDYADEIVPGIFLGEEAAGNVSLDDLRKFNITHILSVGNFPQVHKELKYLQIPIKDNESELLLPHIRKCIEFINECTSSILIHCRAGVSRSPSIVIAWLIIQRNMTYEQAFNKVESKRPCISPNIGFVSQLKTL